MNCSSCGEDVREAKFCPQCGARVEEVKSVEEIPEEDVVPKYCPDCNVTVGEANFCPECGGKRNQSRKNL